MNDNSETVQLLPLTSDIVFKQVFGQEESKPILRVFLNDVLGLDIQSAEQITLLNPIIDPKYIDDKIVVFLSHSSPDIDCRCSPGGMTCACRFRQDLFWNKRDIF